MYSYMKQVNKPQKIFKFVRNIQKFSTEVNTENVVKSSLPDIEIPNIRLPDFLYRNFSKFPDKVAIECGVTGKKYTFNEIRNYSRNLVSALRKKFKTNNGEVIAILLPNIPEYPICVLGSLEAGLVITTINPLYTLQEITNHFILTEAKIIITLESLVKTVQQCSVKIPIIAIKENCLNGWPDGVTNFTELVATNDSNNFMPISENVDEVAAMMSSGGTTGHPKAVQLTHKNIVANILQMQHPYFNRYLTTTNDHQDILYGVMPFFHIYGMVGILFASLHNTTKVVSLPAYHPNLFLRTLAIHKPHIVFVVPHMLTFMINSSLKPEEFDTVRTLFSGAAPLGLLDKQNFFKKINKTVDVVEAYGLTEASPCVTLVNCEKQKELNLKTSSVGEQLANTLIKIAPIDSTTKIGLGPNQEGEILVKGPQVMKGYYKQPDATHNAFSDGWLRTGDVGYYDKNNMFYITDRLKDIIKVKGFQVAPAELEEIIRDHPSVFEAAVVGVPDKKYGEVPRAYVVFKKGTKTKQDDIIKYVAQKTVDYKHLRGGVATLESLPKTLTGKVLRKNLRNL